MGIIISCIVYIGICEGICKMLDFDTFKKKSWVYAIVGTFGSFLIKGLLS